VSNELGLPVPDKLSIWPVEGGRFGIDASFTGSTGFERAHRHERQLTEAGIRYQFRQDLDGAWILRLGPVPAADVGAAVDAFVGGGLGLSGDGP
jgi:hypothetical protein